MTLELGPLLSHGFDLLRRWLAAYGIPPMGAWILIKAIEAGLIVVLVALVPVVLVYAERKISAFMQARLGPMVTGPYGILQTIADGIKLLFKEDIVPLGADRWVHLLAPMVVLTPVFACYAPVPFGQGLVGIDLDIGVLFIFAVSGLSTIGVLMAGWGSGNKFSMIGGLRGAAQLVSYEVPRVLSVVPVLMFYGTQSLSRIALAQQGRWFHVVPQWFVFYPVVGPLSFLIFLIASVAETNRTPFDIPEAESELVAGFHTEYSGLKFALFFMAEYAYMFLACAMAVALFFGGGDGFRAGGLLPSWVWFAGKTSVLVFLFLWFRWTFPRLRVDRLMQFCWQFLLPWSLVNIALAGLLVLVW
jgi:NADH-quinone oxidoreductase subunit H